MALLQFTLSNIVAASLGDNFAVYEKAFVQSEATRLKNLYPQKAAQLEALS